MTKGACEPGALFPFKVRSFPVRSTIGRFIRNGLAEPAIACGIMQEWKIIFVENFLEE